MSMPFNGPADAAYNPTGNSIAGQGPSTIALVTVPSVDGYNWTPSQIGIAVEIAYPSLSMSSEIAANGNIELEGTISGPASAPSTEGPSTTLSEQQGGTEATGTNEASPAQEQRPGASQINAKSAIDSSQVILVEPDGEIKSTGDGTPNDEPGRDVTPLQEQDAIRNSNERPDQNVVPSFLRAMRNSLTTRMQVSSFFKTQLGRIARANKSTKGD